MRLVVNQHGLLIEHEGQEDILCGRINNNNKHNLFDELNAFWATLDKSTCDELYELYQLACEIVGPNPYEPAPNEPGLSEIVKVLLDEVHTYDNVKEFCVGAIPPENSPESFEDSKHYTEELTYTRPEYMKLAVLVTRLKSLAPIICADELFVNHKTGAGVGSMNKTLKHFNSILATECYDGDTFQRLCLFIDHTCTKLKGDNVNLAGSIVDGIGSEELPAYLKGVAIIRGCMLAPIKVPGKNVVKLVNYSLTNELTNKIGRRFNLTKERTFEKMTRGEEKDPGYTDTYAAREEVPSSIPIAMGVWAGDYRSARTSLGIELAPSIIKEFINSIEANPLPQLTVTHIQLIKIAMFDKIIYNTIDDIQAKYLISMIGLAQTWYIENKLFSLARLLSSHGHMITRGREGIVFNPTNYNQLSNDSRELLDRFYTANFPQGAGNKNWDKPYNLTIDAIIKNVEEYTWTQEASTQVEDLLNTRNGSYTPPADLRNDLARALSITLARAKNDRLKSKEKLKI